MQVRYTLIKKRYLPTQSRFAASYKGVMTADAVHNKLYRVRALHIFHNLPYNDGILLKYTLEGIDKATPESS